MNFQKRYTRLMMRGLLLLLVCCLLVTPALAERKVYHWFCKKTDGNRPPAQDGEFWFIGNYNAYYLDVTAKEEDKVLYLTFDAGYENGNVEKIVDVLDAHGVKGAFFVLSHFVKSQPELVRKMAAGGHLLCNHTAGHRNISCLSAEDLTAEVRKLETILTDAGVTPAPFFRPPEGTFSESSLKTLKELGYSTVFWSFAYCDWDNEKQPDENVAIKEILAHTHNGAVILLHPTSATNAAIIDRLLTAWEDEGYRFGTMPELAKRMEEERVRIENLPKSNYRSGRMG